LYLNDEATFKKRAGQTVEANGEVHPETRPVTHRVLRRMRETALPALRGRGMIDN
jgi:hypothetical protein